MADAAKSIDGMSFEAALAELESIVEKLEKGSIPLAKSIASYARGELLKSRCDRLLKDAEMQVERLSVSADSQTITAQKLDGE